MNSQWLRPGVTAAAADLHQHTLQPGAAWSAVCRLLPAGGNRNNIFRRIDGGGDSRKAGWIKMDTFVEQIVVKKKGMKEIAVIVGVLLLALILVLLSYVFLGMLFALVAVGVGYGAWWLITSQNVEFEYSVTNGDIDIDQIIAQRKRKRIVSVTGAKIESFAPYNPAEYAARPFDRTVMAAPSPDAPDTWCFTYHSKKNGHTLVIFQPEKRVIDALKVGLSKLLQLDIERKIGKE